MADSGLRPYGEITALEKLGYLRMVMNALTAGISAFVFGPFRDRDSTPTEFSRHVLYSMIRGGLGSGSLGQLQYMMARTPVVYDHLAALEKFTPRTIEHPLTGCKSHYLGDPKAKTLLVYLHGGGYVMPATPAHLKYLYKLVKDVNASAGSDTAFAVLVLSYNLVPEVAWPKPLAQASDCLNYLIDKEGRDPKTIMIGGDSAGGNLALALISHLLHPHPDASVPRTTGLHSPLGSALVISPWVELANDKRKSKQSCLYTDVSAPNSSKGWAEVILKNRSSDNYIECVNAGADWWRGLEKVVEHTLVWGGGGEVLIDAIKVVMDDMKTASPDSVEISIGHKMCHEQMVVNTMLGYGKGESEHLVENWIQAKL